MSKPKKSRAARIRERIAETTARAKENFVPVESGPDPRLHRHEVAHAVHQQAETAGGAFEDAFDYEDPQSERYIPDHGEYDGHIVFRKTPEEAAGEAAYEKALADPTSVLAPRQRYDADDSGAQRRTIVDAGHELAKKQVSEHHAKDPDRLKRFAAGLGIAQEESTDGNG